MKSLVYISLILISFVNLSALSRTDAEAELKEAKVFLNGAELRHFLNFNVSAGMNEIVIKNIADNINEKSIQISADGKVTIISVSMRKNYMSPDEKPQLLIALEDSLDRLKTEIALLNSEKEVHLAEIDLLNANKNIGGTQGISVAELQKQMDLFRKRLAAVKKEIIRVDEKIVGTKREMDRVQKQINEFNPNRNPESEIVLTLLSDKNTRVNAELTYLTYQSGWQPVYDLRAEEGNSKIKLNYRAKVWQRTGIDWKECTIILSTRNPNEGNTKPELYPWYLNFIEDQRLYGIRGKEPAAAAMEKRSENIAFEADQTSLADYTGVTRSQLAVEFQPELRYSIPSDGKPQIVSLQDYEMEADFSHFAAPKLDKDAFLIASTGDWEKLDLLPGEANIYYGSSFVGTSFIDPLTTADTLRFSFGRDKKVTIDRKMLKDYQEDKFLSSDIERYYAYEINMRNTKSGPIKIRIEETYPISRVEDIEVNLIEWDGAMIDKKTGKLIWEINLKPNESAVRKFAFSVRYPADKAIGGL